MNNPASPIRRPFAGLDTDPWGPIENIKSLLDDVYRYDADGRTIIRELFQNADDAGARTLVFAIAEKGLEGASNPLLRGAALVIVNDGPFPEKDHDGLHRAIGGAKRDDAAKVGRFGLGLKSLFHLCEAFIYLGRDDQESGRTCVGTLNPWAGTDPEKPRADPRYPEWDTVTDADYQLLAELGERLLQDFARDGLLLWVPLRRVTDHLDRGQETGEPYGISKREVRDSDLRRWFADETPLALLLAQAGAVHRVIACVTPPTPQEDVTQTLCDISRTPTTNDQGEVWLGRPILDSGGCEPLRTFRGKAATDSRTWVINGSVVRDDGVLKRVRQRSDWPIDRISLNGRNKDQPRKAAGHASVVLVRPTGADSPPSLVRIRWCVFFPLDDSSAVHSTSPLVETKATGFAGEAAWDVLLHGYFWPAQDRRSIPGVVETGERRQDLDADDVRVALNRAVSENLLLPMIPQALEASLAGLPTTWANAVVGAVLVSSLGMERLDSVCRDHYLVPELQSPTTWKARPRDRRLIAMAGWDGAPDNVRRHLASRVLDLRSDTVLIDGDAKRLGGVPQPWSTEEVTLLLNLVPGELLRKGQVQEWLERALRTASDSATGCLQGPVANVFAEWLGRSLGGALLEPGTLDAWRRLFDLVPSSWRVRVPRGARKAVAELAGEGLFGPGLVAMPIGLDPAHQRREQGGGPDQERLERALKVLGSWLSKATEPQNSTEARIVLAECLLAELVDVEARERVSDLPLMRAHRLPEGRDEAWSLVDLRRGAGRTRVFHREVSATTVADPDADVDAPPNDPVKRIRALAQALGEPCWLVRTGVEHDIRLAHPTDADLAAALVRGDLPLAEEGHRRALLAILGSKGVAETPEGRRALRCLLTGERNSNDDLPLFFVPSANNGSYDTEATAKVLLRLQGRPWALFPSGMTDLPHVVLQTVDANHPLDIGALHLILAEALESTHAPWSEIDTHDTVLLLKLLHPGVAAPDNATRWRKMPLHRRVDGKRGPITERTFRPVAGVELPPAILASIVLLCPDEELLPYYDNVPKLDQVQALTLILASSAPQDYAVCILQLLVEDNGVAMPPPTIRDRLQTTAWIPLAPKLGRPASIAPERLLLLPAAVEEELASVISAGSLQPLCFPAEVAQHVRDSAVVVARSLRGNPREPRQLEALAEAVRASRTEQRTFAGLNLAPSPLTQELLWTGLDTPIAEIDPGWRLVRKSRDACGPLNDNAKAAIEKLADALVGPVPAERQVTMLGALSTRAPGRESPEGKVHRGILSVLAPLAAEVVARLDLPVQDGTWKPATIIARSASGLARCHLLRRDLRETLGLDDHTRPSGSLHRVASPAADTSSAGDRLRRYFEDWQGRVKPGVVGTFLALLGDYQPGGSVEALALEWLTRDPSLRDVSVRDLRERLRGGTWPVVPPPKVAAAFSEGDTVIATNLVGEDFEASAAGTEVTSIFSQDPVHTHHYGMQVWDIRLRKVNPTTLTPTQLESLVSTALQWWCMQALRVSSAQIGKVVKLAQGSQLAVEPVRACILASLPLTLRQLNVNEHRPLMDALLTAESAQRRRAQAPENRRMEADRAEREALEALGKTITESSEHDAFLRARVRERIQAFGYGAASTLLELSQNADDALAQLEEMSDSLPEAARTLTLRVHAMENETTVDVVHFGRPINDTGGPGFPAGVDRQWDMDLYFMMLMNLSAKPGEAARGELGTAPTTGKFGLGFKSVHLVSDLPEVVSGFLSFKVAAGLLPEASPRPDDPALKPIGGCYPTRIRLPLRQSPQTTPLLEELFARFGVARAILPAFSRAIRKIIVEGGPSSGVTEYNGCPLVAGWSVSSETVALGDDRGWKLLRFAMRDRGAPQDSAALLLGVRDGQVRALPESVPFLWNVTPTGEAWNVGYSVNGPVKLDPGRAHADLDNEDTKQVFARLGKGLGAALIDFDDRLTAGDRAVLEPLGVETHGADALRQSLWSQLSRGLAADDRKRTALLRQLHGPNRGLYAWMSERAIAPTGLPAPFASRLPAGIPRELLVVQGVLEQPDICAALAPIEGLTATLADLPAVRIEIARIIGSISPDCRMEDLGLEHVLAKTRAVWQSCLTPTRLLSVQALTTEPALTMVRREGHGDWGSTLVAKAGDGSWQPLRKLLIRVFDREARPGDDEGDPPPLDESLRAALAPESALLSRDYLVDDAMIEAFRRLRARHEVDAGLLWDWMCDAPSDRHAPAVRYLAIGELRGSLLEKAVNAAPRPAWLADFSYVSTLLESAQVRPHEANQVLVTLFHDHFPLLQGSALPTAPPPPPDLQPLPFETACRLVRDLHDKWRDADYRDRAVAAWRDRWYPVGWSDKRLLRALLEHPCDDDESQTAWMIMFTLATTQGLGRTQPEQHRGFVEALMSRRFENDRSWWSHLFERFDDRSNKDTWFAFLEGWADARVGGRFAYDHWLTTLPELFAAWRWLPDYRDLVVATGQMQSGSLVPLLRPRVDPEQERGGIDAPPLPVVRHHWLLSELLRLRVLPSTQPLMEAAWPPSRALEVVMQLLGRDVSRDSHAFSRGVFEFVKELLGPERDPTFFNCFDKPLLSGTFRRSLEDACDAAGLHAPTAEDLEDVGAGWMGDARVGDAFEGGEE